MNTWWCYNHTGNPSVGLTYRGWSYPQAFPNPPATVQPNTPAGQLWFNRLDQQYPATDRDRYNKAWTSWFSTQPGQTWNHQTHLPNYGPYAPRPHTQQVANAYEQARLGFIQQLKDLPAAQAGQAFSGPVMHNCVQTSASGHARSFHQVYPLN
jgi:hypothetical protein